MKLLAIDSSGLVASVGIVTESELIAEYTINYKKTHSQTLLPMIDAIVSMIDLEINEIDGIVVAAGPGSFTGLRIGASTAKGLGLALNKPIISVPTVDALGFNLYKTTDIICPIMDARRNQVYTGLYEFISEEYVTIAPQMAVEISDIAEEVNKLGRSVIFLGDGVEVYKNKLEELLTVPYTFAPNHLLKQRAGALGTLGLLYYKQGKVVSADEFEPIYLRLSQAERELLEKQSGENNDNS
jgi:tRNA threonylcarbamoyladenosine biosynthesis protein TsaB